MRAPLAPAQPVVKRPNGDSDATHAALPLHVQELLREEEELQSPYEQLLGAVDVADDLWPSQVGRLASRMCCIAH